MLKIIFSILVGLLSVSQLQADSGKLKESQSQKSQTNKIVVYRPQS